MTYVAYLDAGFGVAISGGMVTFYPWRGPRVHGFAAYLKHVLDVTQRNGGFDTFWIPKDADILTIKCLIEDGLNRIKEKLHGNDQAQRADAPTRQDVV